MHKKPLILVATAAFTLTTLFTFGMVARFCYPPPEVQDEDGSQMQVQQETHAARGFGTDSARVDSQLTLAIPFDQADAVYEYLKATYVGQEDLLHEEFPDAKLRGLPKSDISHFTDRYFDTPDLDLYRSLNSCRHRRRINTTDPNDRKSGRELVQMKVTPPGQFMLRTELKYEVKASKGKIKGSDDIHPLVRMIAKEQREDFKKIYRDAGIDPYSLQHILTIEQTRRRGYVNMGSKPVFSFSVDEGVASILWTQGRYASVDLGLVEIEYTEADEATRKEMWAIREAVKQDLLDHFPDLVQTTRSKYSIVLKQMMDQLPLISGLWHFKML